MVGCFQKMYSFMVLFIQNHQWYIKLIQNIGINSTYDPEHIMFTAEMETCVRGLWGDTAREMTLKKYSKYVSTVF